MYEGLAIAGRIRSSKRTIITEGYGHMMSAASLILAAGHKRRMSQYSWFMHHKMGYVVEGDHDSIKEFVSQAEREDQKWAEMMAEFTSESKAFWNNIAHKKDAYFDAYQCLTYGVVDELF